MRKPFSRRRPPPRLPLRRVNTAAPQPDHIARIDALSKTAKTTWLSLLAYLAFVGVTLLAVEDADFFLDTRQTDLPLIGVAIPTAQFFLFGPILGTALYVYLHLYLLKLWEALAAAPPTLNGEPLSLQIAPWLVTDLALAIRGQGSIQPRPLDWLSHLVTRFLVFAAGPLVIGWFWIRYWPAHKLTHSLPNAVLVIFCACVMVVSTCSFIGLREEENRSSEHRYRCALSALTLFIFVIFILSLTFLEISCEERGVSLGTAGWTSIWFSPAQKLLHSPPSAVLVIFCALVMIVRYRWAVSALTLFNLVMIILSLTFFKISCEKRWVSFGTSGWTSTWLSGLSPAQLQEVTFQQPPPGWLPHAAAIREFRVEWCSQQGVDLVTCGHALIPGDQHPRHVNIAREAWCANSSGDVSFYDTPNACREFFAALERRFQTDWVLERRASISTVAWKPVNKDLRRADLGGANLIGADLRGALLNSASLARTQLEGVDLRGAKAKGVDFRGADIAGMNFGGADLRGSAFGQIQRANVGMNISVEGTNAIMDLREAGFGPLADLSLVFLDGSVIVPDALRERAGNPCQWIADVLPEEIFYSTWFKWLGLDPAGTAKAGNIPPDFRNSDGHVLPEGCVWKTGPMPSADAH